MNELLPRILSGLATSTRDILPVVLVIAFFQLACFKRPPAMTRQVLTGLVLVVLGLYLFVEGLTVGLFPLGETMAGHFSRPGYLGWVYLFGFAVGYAAAMAEPALIAVAMKAEEITSGGIRRWPLRNSVALGAGIGLTVGVFRMVHGHSLYLYILCAYLMVIALTCVTPREVIALAYDSGGVTTSTVTVPLVAALGLGLATSLPGRDPMVDGFGLIAFAALFPLITVMGYATLARLWAGHPNGTTGHRGAGGTDGK